MVRFFSFAVVTITAIVAATILFKSQLERMAGDAARKFTQTALDQGSTEAIAIEIARRVHEQYRAAEQRQDTHVLFKLRPYLTYRFVPDFARIEPGAIEALLIEGICDSAARATIYILRSVGIPAEQLNLIGRNGWAHSIVQAANPDGSLFLLDPLYGVAPQHDGDVLNVEETKQLQKSGTAARDIWKSISDGPRYHRLYEDFLDFWVATQDSSIEFEVQVNLENQERVQIGQIDQSSREVGAAAAKHGLTVYWHYLGHRYARGWVRSLIFAQPTKVSFILTEDVREGVITSDVKPDGITGNILHYTMQRGQKLSFHDGRARMDWLKLNSYQDVDAIVFERVE
jgi:hypothetical protein